MISNCGMDERGAFRGGKAGDQTGGEWTLRKWYSHPWDVVCRYPAATVRHWMGDQARAAALNDCIGYDQSDRLSFWVQLRRENYDVNRIGVKCEADCSSGVLAIVKAAGFRFGIKALQAVSETGYTGNMEAILRKAGFQILTDDKHRKSADWLDSGDILLNTTRHTAFCVDAGPKCDANKEPGVTKVEKRGIDVSYAQGKINWEKAKDKIDYAILRCGYGSNIVAQDDDQWDRNVSECERLGIPYGVYLYSYAKTDEAARSEAEHVLRLLKGHTPQLPVYFDSEERGTESVAKRLAETFIQRIKRVGYECGIYASRSWYNAYLSGIEADSYWIAQYGTNNGIPQIKPSIDRDIDIWQFTSVGKVPGIDTNVDMNIRYIDDAPKWENVPSKAVNDEGIKYRVHGQTYGWLPSVHDGQIAGTVGKSKRIEAIKITPPEGVELEVDVHLQGIGWKTYKGIKKGKSSGTGSSDTDPIMGTIGQSRRLEAIRIRCTKNPTGKKLCYQGHCQGIGWQTPVREGVTCGTVGQSRRLEAVRIWFD